MKFSKIANDTFDKLQLGAGILLKEFTPTSGEFSDANIFGATDGVYLFLQLNL